MTDAPLLIEIGVEELPPVRLDKLAQSFADGFAKLCEQMGLNHGALEVFVAPRRLGLMIENFPAHQEDKTVVRKGPSVQAGFDASGEPTPAATGFARSCGVEVHELERENTEKGEWLVHSSLVKGQSIDAFLPEMITKSLHGMSIAKRMRWSDSSIEFVRPVHWVCLMHGANLIDATIMEVQSKPFTYGHRVHHPEPIEIEHASMYPKALEQGFVIGRYDQRKQTILDKAQALAKSLDATLCVDDDLLDLVTGLNEWPTPMVADFSSDFLSVAQEALMTSMTYHQKCFPLVDKKGTLLPHFVLVANTQAHDPAMIIKGNERVMHARLSDAKFFFEQDIHVPLQSHHDALKAMTFQKKLGSTYDKSMRVKRLASHIGAKLDANIDLCERAAELAKCDLMTEMVKEFPELQGIMGYHYALAQSEPSEVAIAIKDAYLPKFSKDNLPSTTEAIVLSLAERLDTLVGIFGIGKVPTGDKDPFALRRNALAIIRIIIEKEIDIDLRALIEQSVQEYHTLIGEECIDPILAFCFERVKSYYQERGISLKVLESIGGPHAFARPCDFAKRVHAVDHFQSLPQAQALAQANKRVKNILSKSELHASEHASVESSLLHEPQEKALFENLEQLRTKTSPMIEQGQYTQTLTELAELKDVVDDFFEHVMVNVEQEDLKTNRLHLLSRLQHLFMQVADVSRLQ